MTIIEKLKRDVPLAEWEAEAYCRDMAEPKKLKSELRRLLGRSVKVAPAGSTMSPLMRRLCTSENPAKLGHYTDHGYYIDNARPATAFPTDYTALKNRNWKLAYLEIIDKGQIDLLGQETKLTRHHF